MQVSLPVEYLQFGALYGQLHEENRSIYRHNFDRLFKSTMQQAIPGRNERIFLRFQSKVR